MFKRTADFGAQPDKTGHIGGRDTICAKRCDAAVCRDGHPPDRKGAAHHGLALAQCAVDPELLRIGIHAARAVGGLRTGLPQRQSQAENSILAAAFCAKGSLASCAFGHRRP